MKKRLANWLVGVTLAVQVAAVAADAVRDRLSAAEDVARLGQEIAKNYFYSQLGIRVARANYSMERALQRLDEQLDRLAAAGLPEDQQNVLLFLQLTRDELRALLERPYDEENGALMLDYSESFLEGAEAIAAALRGQGGREEKILKVIDRSQLLLERINKLYIAYKAGFRDYNNVHQLEQAVEQFETNLEAIRLYPKYSEEVRDAVARLERFWPLARRFYLGIEQGALPAIVLASTRGLERELERIEAFHVEREGEARERIADSK